MPESADCCVLANVLHDWGEDSVRSLLTASCAALPPGGFLVDHDVHINATKTGPLAAAEYSVFLMHSTPGKCWSTSELTLMLQEAGFAAVTCRPTPADRSAVIAQKSSARSAVPDPATS